MWDKLSFIVLLLLLVRTPLVAFAYNQWIDHRSSSIMPSFTSMKITCLLHKMGNPKNFRVITYLWTPKWHISCLSSHCDLWPNKSMCGYLIRHPCTYIHDCLCILHLNYMDCCLCKFPWKEGKKKKPVIWYDCGLITINYEDGIKREGLTKNLDHFSICACHPCAGAMLIFSVSFQFYQMSPKGQRLTHSLQQYIGLYILDAFVCGTFIHFIHSIHS